MAKQFPKVMSPTVEVNWAFLDKPDTKFDSVGYYQADLVFDVTNPEHKKFLGQLKSMLPDGAKNTPWKQDAEQKNIFVVKVKQKAEVKGFSFKPKMFDCNGNPIVNPPVIGNGTTINAQLEVREYDLKGGGIRLNPVAIQIVDLVEYSEEEDEEGTVDNGSNPFGAVDGSFKQDSFNDVVAETNDDAVAAEEVEDEFNF